MVSSVKASQRSSTGFSLENLSCKLKQENGVKCQGRPKKQYWIFPRKFELQVEAGKWCQGKSKKQYWISPRKFELQVEAGKWCQVSRQAKEAVLDFPQKSMKNVCEKSDCVYL
ncbi:uncharacterized protein LOC123545042 isoform X3 [Mercenaria mercenaria]|uniref:uncharacterized protein LOC123545042 isoform X3 n=1 Tax=Mercenaria mercenaria TaxID=6596 RepID=UPI00234E8C27|nr:uncharacterized protein LOC123545042 isoform X3 [Mercenaria mercenaria]